MLKVRFNGGASGGLVRWDEPPTVGEVEAVLKGHLGEPIRSVGDLEV
jgi:hypothetical protein